jgi:steroid delta-isomerase-like uncharacterized protein
MSAAQDNLRRAIDAANRHDAAAFAATYAVDAVVHDPSYPEPLRGRQAVEEDFGATLKAFPDLRASAGTVIEDGEWQANRWAFEGTNTGPVKFPALELAATGKSMRLQGAAFARLNAAGEVVEEHRYYDNAGLAAQLGIA